MVVDAVRTYLDAANGLTELSRKDAVAAAKALLRADGQAVNAASAQSPVTGEEEARPATVGQSIQNLAGELIETSQSNRAAIADLVHAEVTRQLESVDAVPRAEYERVVRRVAELERRLAARHAVERALATGAGIGTTPAPSPEAGHTQEEVQAAPGRPEEAEEPQEAQQGQDERGEQETGPAEDGATEGADGATEEGEEKKTSGTKKRTGDGTARGPAKSNTAKPKSRSTGKRTTKAKGSTGSPKK